MLKKLIDYNDWANQQLFHAIKQHGDAVPPGVMSLLSHMMTAQSIWLSRVREVLPNVGVWEACDLETCMRLHEESTAQFRQLLTWPEAELRKTISYVNTQGLHFENVVEDILMHVINHSTYHRAQIATEMRKNGITPVPTDYIVFIRGL